MLTRREFLRAQMMGITLIVVEPLHLLGSPVGGTDHASHLPWSCGTSMIGKSQRETEIPSDLAEGVLPTGKVLA
jgi:hypothetical protein